MVPLNFLSLLDRMAHGMNAKVVASIASLEFDY